MTGGSKVFLGDSQTLPKIKTNYMSHVCFPSTFVFYLFFIFHTCSFHFHFSYYIPNFGHANLFFISMILAVNQRFFPKGPKIASDKSAFHFFTHRKTIPLFTDTFYILIVKIADLSLAIFGRLRTNRRLTTSTDLSFRSTGTRSSVAAEDCVFRDFYSYF